MDAEINPLRAWLDRVGETGVAFQERTGLSSRTLYDVLGDVPKNFGILTLRRIEEATGGEVTVRQIIDWMERVKDDTRTAS